ncbi:MAG: nickel pincer cofactor biosynthesis protein LarC [Acidobacteria bacterium]|nr:nickel pincer cofactor biosynthesis protein LarC [Acidobacteriota bacterium]
MGTVLYLDCSSGASGDMLLGALIDMGLSIERLQAALAGILPAGCELQASRVQRSGISATRFAVVEPADAGPEGHHAHRHLSQIVALIEGMPLAASIRRKAIDLFGRLGAVEADIHGIPVEHVHFHEVGALDSIVDIVGAVWAIEQLGVGRVVSSPLNVGAGTVETAHGRLPVPAPATLRLLEGAPIYSSGTPMELVTPTGALLVTGHAASFGPMPAMTVRQAGYGAGSREIEGHPNVLRAVIGETRESDAQSTVAVLECNIDDMNPQVFGYLMKRLYDLGALDVFYTPVQMKKSRPGTLVTVITPVSLREAALDMLFEETTTIGVRHQEMLRECLHREWTTVSTRYGEIRIKIARRGERVTNAAPEFEDCARLAAAQKVPVKDVHAAATRAYLDRAGRGANEM